MRTKLLPNKFYHIYNRVIGEEFLFFEERNYAFFLEKINLYLSPFMKIHAYAMLPDQVHLLIEIISDEKLSERFEIDNPQELTEIISQKLSKQFSKLFSCYAQAFNKVYKRKGSLFIKNFKRKELVNTFDVQRMAAYIHLTPVHLGLVKSVYDWRWSSYRNFYNGNSNILKQTFESVKNFNYIHTLMEINHECFSNTIFGLKIRMESISLLRRKNLSRV